MTPLGQFILTFIAACAVTAGVTVSVEGDGAGREIKNASRFFVYMVVGIALFSALVYGLEQLFVKKG
jgi:hypothetical protein